jgi:protein-tyrosine phosphatase
LLVTGRELLLAAPSDMAATAGASSEAVSHLSSSSSSFSAAAFSHPSIARSTSAPIPPSSAVFSAALPCSSSALPPSPPSLFSSFSYSSSSSSSSSSSRPFAPSFSSAAGTNHVSPRCVIVPSKADSNSHFDTRRLNDFSSGPVYPSATANYACAAGAGAAPSLDSLATPSATTATCSSVTLSATLLCDDRSSCELPLPLLQAQVSSSGCSSASSSPDLSASISPEDCADLLREAAAVTPTPTSGLGRLGRSGSSPPTPPSPPSVVLLIDVRPQRAFAAGHVRGAIGACCTLLQLRRLVSGKLSTESIFCSRQRKLYREAKESGHHTAIVLYDDACDQAALSAADLSPLRVLLTRVSDECAQVYFLEGGFSKFAQMFPCLVERSVALPVPLMLAGCDESLMRHGTGLAPLPNTPGCMPPTLVEPYLYLGTQEDSKDGSLLQRLNVKYILNVTADCPNHFAADPSFHYMKIPIRDTWNQNIAVHFSTTYDFIEEARRSGSAVLVHCMAGISRSATIVIAYLMCKHHASMNSMYNRLKEKRCTISPNLDFMGHLLQYERVLGIEHESDGSSDPLSASPLAAMSSGSSSGAGSAASIGSGTPAGPHHSLWPQLSSPARC